MSENINIQVEDTGKKGGSLLKPPDMAVNGQPVQSKSSLSVPSPGGLFPLPNSPQLQSGSATGNPRNKVGLKKGYSLMDWIRLSKSGKDLTGVGGPRVNGKIREVTKSELKKHKKRKDAWMAINGAVYNVTAYMDFHPGGWDELVKGAGTDATNLFNEVHRWVNYESLLAACLVGKLVDDHDVILAPPPPRSLDLPPPKPVIPPIPVRPVPTYDYFQSDKKITVNIYTRRKGLSSDNVVTDIIDNALRVVCFFPDDTGFVLHQQLYHSVEDNLIHRVGSGGKIEVELLKSVANRWQGLGNSLELHSWFGELKDMKVTYRRFKVKETQQNTHDTRHLVLVPVHPTNITVYPGHHVHFRGEREGMEIVRSYTPVVPLEGTWNPGLELHFLIKIYKDGVFTPTIGLLNEGDEVEVSDPTGNFKLSQIQNKDRIYFLAAGTGITPVLRLLPLVQNTPTVLLNFNKTEKDVIWAEELKSFAAKSPWLKIVDIFSDQPQYSGLKGRIREEILDLYISKENNRICLTCGPPAFLAEADRLLRGRYNFSSEEIHLFQG